MSLIFNANEWIENYNTIKTRESAKTSLNAFEIWLKENSLTINDFVELTNKNEDSKYIEINKFVKSLHLAPASIKQYYAFIKSYLRVKYRIKLDSLDQKQFIKFKPILKINREPLTKQIIKDFCINANVLHRTIYLIQVSSGMRISESLNLKKENFDFSVDPIKITIPANITKTKTSRITFISKEAKSSIDQIGNSYFQEKSLNSVEQYFYKLRKNLGYLDKYENSRNYHVNIHSFRAYTRTIGGKFTTQDFIEDLIGHSGYLKQYVRIDESEKINYYRKLEPHLRILN